MKYYADSSFLVSCYLLDANSAKAKEILVKLGVPLPFTDLHALEVPNALRLGVFRGVISQTQADAALGNIDADLSAGCLYTTTLDWAAGFQTAARLSEKYAAMNGSRSLDILHIAAAKALRAGDLISFDARQRSLAASAGFNILP
jgi:predicted nucleic acid-binding protein